MVAVPCCLDSWVGKDMNTARGEWGDKMDELVEQYGEVKVEAIKKLGEQIVVKIPQLDGKFVKKVMSRADILKKKLKMMK